MSTGEKDFQKIREVFHNPLLEYKKAEEKENEIDNDDKDDSVANETKKFLMFIKIIVIKLFTVMMTMIAM